MENKLKQSIQEIQIEEFGNIVISPTTDKLFELIKNVSTAYHLWAIENGSKSVLDLEYAPNEESFNYFIENVYKQ